MARDTGTVTEVGAGNIQFYIPTSVSSAEECVFDPNDGFQVITLPEIGLLIKQPDATPTVEDFVPVLDDAEPLETTATED